MGTRMFRTFALFTPFWAKKWLHDNVERYALAYGFGKDYRKIAPYLLMTSSKMHWFIFTQCVAVDLLFERKKVVAEISQDFFMSHLT